jgi:hypothetical protein
MSKLTLEQVSTNASTFIDPIQEKILGVAQTMADSLEQFHAVPFGRDTSQATVDPQALALLAIGISEALSMLAEVQTFVIWEHVTRDIINEATERGEQPTLQDVLDRLNAALARRALLSARASATMPPVFKAYTDEVTTSLAQASKTCDRTIKAAAELEAQGQEVNAASIGEVINSTQSLDALLAALKNGGAAFANGEEHAGLNDNPGATVPTSNILDALNRAFPGAAKVA